MYVLLGLPTLLREKCHFKIVSNRKYLCEHCRVLHRQRCAGETGKWTVRIVHGDEVLGERKGRG